MCQLLSFVCYNRPVVKKIIIVWLWHWWI